MRNGNIGNDNHKNKIESVLILPMRNGNLFRLIIQLPKDNGSYPTYEEWKLYSTFHNVSSNVNVLILPMRNGNQNSSILLLISSTSSYPTYEEWKRLPGTAFSFTRECSYPTYEEWKLNISINFVLFQEFGSYPTYEEWKL